MEGTVELVAYTVDLDLEALVDLVDHTLIFLLV